MAATSEQPSPPKPWENGGQSSTPIAENIQAATPLQQTTFTTTAQAQPSNTTTQAQQNQNGISNQNNTTYQQNGGYNNGYNNQFQNQNRYGYNSGTSPYNSYGYSSPYGGGMGGYGMNRGYMPYGSAGMPLSNIGMALGSLHHATSSIGQMGELMGMNADALQHAFFMFFGLIERIGFGFLEMVNFATGRVDLTYYERNPIIDPKTGQPLPPPTVEQVKKDRKEKVKKIAIGVAIIFFGYKIIRFLIRRNFSKKLTQAEKLQKRWNRITGESMKAGNIQNSNWLTGALGQPMQPYGAGMYGGGMYGGGMYGAGMYGGGTYGGGMYNGLGMYGGGMYNGGMYGNGLY